MLKVGITGGIGSGKTTACKIFEVLGVPVFYADEVAKRVMTADAVLVSSVQETFGAGAYSAAGELNRKFLADIVFNDARQLEKLNALVHPAVFRAFDLWAKSFENVPYVVKEAALLFESGSYRMCDLNILVTAPEDLKIRRITRRDKISVEAVRQRMNKQMTDDEKLPMADFLIKNDDQHLLIPQVLQLHQYFMEVARA